MDYKIYTIHALQANRERERRGGGGGKRKEEIVFLFLKMATILMNNLRC